MCASTLISLSVEPSRSTVGDLMLRRLPLSRLPPIGAPEAPRRALNNCQSRDALKTARECAPPGSCGIFSCRKRGTARVLLNAVPQ